MNHHQFIPFEQVTLQDGFWKNRARVNKDTSLNNIRKRFEETGRFDALRFNYLKTAKKPHIFYDSDVAKWMEAVAYLSVKYPKEMEPHLELCDELIDCMANAQRENGYLNSTMQQIEPENIFQLRDHHELYCAGHLIEAAIAYEKATGKDKFRRIMEKYCDYIHQVFLVEKSAAFVTPGHQEIELALLKLFDFTGKEQYRTMAKFFLEQRGGEEQMVYPNRKYIQDDVDIYHLEDAVGHCVRAIYFYTGIAQLAASISDEALLNNLKTVFADMTRRKMYITGGFGSTFRGESFTVPYDLPNKTAYSESCTAIAAIHFACRMREMDRSSQYGDLVERVLYNLMLASTTIDGKAFFYENPLEIAMEEYGREWHMLPGETERLPITQRLEVFNCSCCPPNIARFFAMFEGIIALAEEDGLVVEQYIPADLKGSYGTLSIRGDYATTGKMTLSSDNYQKSTLSLRIPAWSNGWTATLNGVAVSPIVEDGYAKFEVGTSFVLELDFKICPMAVSANPLVSADLGRIAITYGPVVYCLEKEDNGARLNQIEVDPKEVANAVVSPDFHGLNSLSLPAYRLKEDDRLYFPADESALQPITAKFIPYFSFANRGEGDMLVWVRRHGC